MSDLGCRPRLCDKLAEFELAIADVDEELWISFHETGTYLEGVDFESYCEAHSDAYPPHPCDSCPLE